MLSPEEIQSNLLKFYELIENHISEPRTTQLLGLYQSQEENLALAPASSRTAYHNAFPGGYVDHVIRVVEVALTLCDVWEKFGADMSTFTKEELVFAALNHDLGKLGYNGKPMYIPNDSEWHIKNQGAVYKPNTESPFMLVQDASLYVLQQAGIVVSFNEYLAIKVHDGLYDDSNKAYYISNQNESKLRSCMPMILHQADIIAARTEWEREWSGKLGQAKPKEAKPSSPTQYKQQAEAKKLSTIGTKNPGLINALKGL